MVLVLYWMPKRPSIALQRDRVPRSAIRECLELFQMRFSVAMMWSCSQTALLPRLFEFVRGALQKGIFCRLCIQLHRLCPPCCGLRRDWYRRSVSDFGLSSVGGTQVPVCICRTGEPHRIPLAWHRFLQWLKGLDPTASKTLKG